MNDKPALASAQPAAAKAPSAVAVTFTVLVPFGLGYYLSYLYRTVNVVIAPNLAADLGLGPADLGLLTSVYFVSFAAFQLPLGMLLDRYGPRRVQAALLLVAAAGSALFAISANFAVVTMGRALIGLGVSGCLMGMLKANAQWWPREKLPLVNGIGVAFGSFGALSATVPVEWLLGFVDWRTIFALLAIATVAVVAMTLFLVPEKDGQGASPAGGGLAAQLRDLGMIYGSGFFWRIGGIVFTHSAAFLGYQALWMGPWLRDVAGMGAAAVAETMLLFNLGMFVGVISLGAIAERVQRFGVRTMIVVRVCVAVSILVQAMFSLEATGLAPLLCLAFGFFGSSPLLLYVVQAEHFPVRLLGRSNTAQNMLVFVGAFAAQWGVGAIINLWPTLADGRYDPAGHQAALVTVIALELAAYVWFLWPYRGRPLEDAGSNA
jgi:predicted MFS family arabinose efflux permease